jgi:hypothetical protein
MIWDVRKYTNYRVNPPVDETESKVKSLPLLPPPQNPTLNYGMANFHQSQ